jgi:hypothetical protein
MGDAVSGPEELLDVYAAMDASAAAFNAGDIESWIGANHPDVHSFQLDHFIGMADFTAGVAETQVAISDGDWTTLWREGVVEGDAACVWGECEWPYRLGEERHVVRMGCSWYFVNMDGAWKGLFSHYSLLHDQVERT